MSNKLRTVFMGTPAFAATILEQLLESQDIVVTGVYTQPDRPAGRGKKLKISEVKQKALEHSIPVYQPINFSNSADVETLASLAPDVLIVAAYGLILSQKVLDIPRLMSINVHASLLPKYRGAAPIQRVLINGEIVTGVTIMKMEAGLDTGPMLLQQAVGIDINETSEMLHNELAQAGGELLLIALKRLLAGSLPCINQDNNKATYAAKLTKQDGVIDFTQTVKQIHDRIKGVTPWPGAFFSLNRHGQEPLTVSTKPGVYPFSIDNGIDWQNTRPGDVVGLHGDDLLIRCGDGCYSFNALRPSGKKEMSGKSFYNGYLGSIEGAYAGNIRA